MTEPDVDNESVAVDEALEAVASLRSSLGSMMERLGSVGSAEYEGASADGRVIATARGARLSTVQIDPHVYDRPDHAALTASLLQAVRDALTKSQQASTTQLRGAGLLPPQESKEYRP